MESMEAFQVLGIGQTKDERAIKTAYREKLGVTNPEDNPEGFKRLRRAYELACRYAESLEEQPEEEKDETASGIWVEKAAEIYKNIISRQDAEKWQALFQEDVFLSLVDEEECRFKLLRFLMDHFKLPTQVWQLLNEKLFIIKEAAKLRERFPADFIRYIISKCERGEDVEFSQFEGEPEAPYDLFLQYYDRCWQAIQEENTQQAAEYIKNADELKIFHPVMEICRANLLVKQGNALEAMERLTALKQRFPEDAMICFNTAEIMWKNGRKEKAAQIYEELRGANDNHYMSNVRLSEWYYEQQRFKEAKKCAETVLSSGADDGFMELLAKINGELEKGLEKEYEGSGGNNWEAGMELGWCCLQDGKISRGVRIAEELEKRIPEERETERKGLLTKLLIEEAEYERAIELSKRWQEELEQRVASAEEGEEKEKDLDRIRQAHLIRMQSYRNLGYRDKKKLLPAIEEAEQIETGTGKDIGLFLEKAQIYMEMEEYEKSMELVGRLVEEFQIYAAFATSLEVYKRQWDAPGVIQASRQCINYFPKYVRAYEYAAKVYLDLNRKEELKQIFAEAEKNEVKSVILEAYRYQMDMTEPLPESSVLDEKLTAFRREYASKVSEGSEKAYKEGLPILNTYLYCFPGTYMLVERGIFHRAAHRYEEAKEDFEKALAENPAQPYALNGLSFVYKYMGNYEKALFYMKKAVLYKDEDMSPVIYADMANLYALLGDFKRSVEAYKIYESLAGRKNRYQMQKMAESMAAAGKVEEAVRLLGEVLNTDDDALLLCDKQSMIYQDSGCAEKAQAVLDRWGKELKVKFSSAERLMLTAGIGKKGNINYRNYYSRKAWQDLMYGDKKKAMKWFDRFVALSAKAGGSDGALGDAVFAAILCGDENRGRKYAQKLKESLAADEQSGGGTYYNREKSRLQLTFLANYYTETEEELENLLNQEDHMSICHFCSYCICKEMEAVRILFLLRVGKEGEALERLQKNRKIQPHDEYMIAIQHMKG